MKTLLLDNYDSFTYNLYQYVGELGGNPLTYRNDQITPKEIREKNPTHIIISPGPGTPENPEDFGVCAEVIMQFGKSIPILGVCLGHQGIAHVFGGSIIHAPEVMHGKTSIIEHNKKEIFKNLENPLKVMRYHSLMVNPETFPEELEITATTCHSERSEESPRQNHSRSVIMALKHKRFPIFGIQFHPESIGTPQGKKILQNFLDITGKNIKN